MTDVAEKLDERSLRRPDFVAGPEVVLLDGQAWTFPEARVRNVAAPPPDRFRRWSSLGDDHAGRLKALDDAATGSEVIGSSLDLAAWMLMRNYRLTYEQLGELVQFDFSSGASEDDQRFMVAVMEACSGRGPKPPAVGVT
jgi:hypothetical protein